VPEEAWPGLELGDLRERQEVLAGLQAFPALRRWLERLYQARLSRNQARLEKEVIELVPIIRGACVEDRELLQMLAYFDIELAAIAAKGD
jgi:hypothetical protein